MLKGPAKVIVRRRHEAKGYVEQIILRVPALSVPGRSIDTAKLPVHVECYKSHLTLQLYVENVSHVLHFANKEQITV